MPKIRQYPRVEKPTGKMLRDARSMLAERNKIERSKPLEKRQIFEIKAEVNLYKHAMNLSEELWKHYNKIIDNSKKPKKIHLDARNLAEKDFKEYSLRHEVMLDYLKQRTKKR